MRNLEELNINDGGRPVTRPSPSDRSISDFEHTFGLAFPEELKRLLNFANGGHPEVDCLDGSRGRFAVNRFYSLTDDRDDAEGMWWATEQWRPILGAGALPFADDGGDNQYFLDLTQTPHRVFICLHDENFATVELAASLDDFIDRLEIHPDMI